MSKSIQRELDAARGEAAFWREFADATAHRFSTGEVARIIAMQERAERRLAELEHAVSSGDEYG